MTDDTSDNLNVTWLMKGMMGGFGLLVIALLGWMGVNVSHIPGVEKDISYIQHDIRDIQENVQHRSDSEAGQTDKQNIVNNDHELRIRQLENTRHR